MAATVFQEATHYSVREQDGSVTVGFVRTGDTSAPVTITYATNDSTALDGADYIGQSGIVTIAAGETRATVTIPIINDQASEPTETFSVSIVDVQGATLLFPRTSRVDILDDETPAVDPIDPPLVSNYQVSQQTVIGGIVDPVTFEWSPIDPHLVYIGSKTGTINVYNTDTGAFVSTFLDIRDQVNSAADRGLLDIALDPNFPAKPYIYAFYVVDPADAAGKTGVDGADGAGNRYSHVVRFEADPATNYTTLKPGSQPVVLLGGAGQSLADISGHGAIDSTANLAIAASDVDPLTGQYKQDYLKVDSLSHAGGSLEFGPDGALYVSVGDGTSFDAVDPRSISVQSVNALAGKILRIDPNTGDGFADNPFYQPGMSLDSNAAKVYQMGIRNPYTMTFAPDGQLMSSETGWFSWEEINKGGPGANFGWPYFEGGDNGVLLQTTGYQDLASAAGFYQQVANGTITVTPGLRGFSHNVADPGYAFQAIVGSDSVYTGDVYPTEFKNSYFFTNISEGTVFSIDINDQQNVQYLMKAPSGFGPVHFAQGPDGYMYYADLVTGSFGRFLIQPGTAVATVNGNAQPDATGQTYTLTSNAPQQAGSVWWNQRVDVSQNFQIAFDLNAGTDDLGADGIAFALHADPNGPRALGNSGGDFGVHGIANGIGIAFDTYENTAVNGVGPDTTYFFSAGDLTTFQSNHVAIGNIEDGAAHHVVVSWNAASHTMTYTVDGVARGTLTGDIVTQYLGGSHFAYYGFGGGTGGAFNQQQVSLTSFTGTLEGGGPVTIAGTAGDDVVNAGGSVAGQQLPTGFGDRISGAGGNDSLEGLGGNDTIMGDAGNDTLIGGAGADSMQGGDGNDTLVTTGGDAVLKGGNGIDTLIVLGNVGVTGYQMVSNGIDKFFGGDGNDAVSGSLTYAANLTMSGGGGNDKLNGGVGGDSMDGGTGSDTLNGNAGNDTMQGGDGNDSMSGNVGNDTLFGRAGSDTMYGGAGNDSVDGGGGNDRLFGIDGADTLAGSWGNDSITGGAGNDRLMGGHNSDTLAGGAGADTLTGGPGNDYFSLDITALTGGTDVITDFLVVNDTIELDKADFASLQGNASNVLLASNFVIGPAAATANQHIIYTSSTGVLSYDVDGAGGQAAVQIAKLAAGLALTSADFTLF